MTSPLAGRRLATAAIQVLLIFAVALLVINAVYLFEDSFTPLRDYEVVSERFEKLAAIPVLSAVPLPLPYGYVQGIDMVSQSTSRDRWTYCLGEHRQRGFPHYFLIGLLTKTTVPFLILLGWSFGALGKRLIFDRGRLRTVEVFLLLPALVYFVYLSFFFHFQIGFRYALPILPFLFVFVSQLAPKKPTPPNQPHQPNKPKKAAPPTKSILGWAVVALLVLHAASTLRVFPHYLAYFNEPSGGPSRGWHYLIDSNLDWGQDRGTARAYVERRAAEENLAIALNPPRPQAGWVMVNVNNLVGLKPQAARRYAWLRDNFQPVDHVGYSHLVYEISDDDLAACCAQRQR